jgi:hypothetical protein
MEFSYILPFVGLLFTTLLNSEIVLKNQKLSEITWYMERLQCFIEYCENRGNNNFEEKISFMIYYGRSSSSVTRG